MWDRYVLLPTLPLLPPLPVGFLVEELVQSESLLRPTPATNRYIVIIPSKNNAGVCQRANTPTLQRAPATFRPPPLSHCHCGRFPSVTERSSTAMYRAPTLFRTLPRQPIPPAPSDFNGHISSTDTIQPAILWRDPYPAPYRSTPRREENKKKKHKTFLVFVILLYPSAPEYKNRFQSKS